MHFLCRLPGDVLLTAADNNGAARRRAGVVKGQLVKL
jgi:hypothetical protein